MIRALLVDDEQPARERLRRLLSLHDDIEIVGEAEDGEQAVQKIVEIRPDVVFLDIQMPECSGMEVAGSLPSPRPKIIFCTAYEEYAVDAFELHAVDYLLKPVNRARLEQALERVRGNDADSSVDERERSLDRLGQSGGKHPARYLARRGSRFCVIPDDEVLYFASDGGQTKLQTGEHHYWMQPTLAELEQRLDPDRFVRISRSAVVRLDAIQEIVPLPGRHGELRLRDDSVLEVSRRRFKELIEKLARG